MEALQNFESLQVFTQTLGNFCHIKSITESHQYFTAQAYPAYPGAHGEEEIKFMSTK